MRTRDVAAVGLHDDRRALMVQLSASSILDPECKDEASVRSIDTI